MASPLTCPDTPMGPEAHVYRPQDDTHLLIAALAAISLPGIRALDLCTGSGAVAVAAARGGADVTAVDACPHAAAATRQYALDAGVEVGVLCSDLADFHRTGFDLVTCNPPYVPTPRGTESSAGGPAHAWNAGHDGRAVLDVVCARLPKLLADDGTALIVQSELADIDATIAALQAGGLRAKVVRERVIPFGPVIESRRAPLVRAGILDAASDRESIAVIRADRGIRPDRGARGRWWGAS